MPDVPSDTRAVTAERPTRRIVFTGLASLGVAVALAGCGGGNDASTGGSSGGGASSSGGGQTASAGQKLASTSDVPVGGGLILADANVVITQPEEGTFKAFSATCTHQGFTVTSVEDDTIMCNHHGSEYSGEDGSVKQGPAAAALKAVQIKVSGTTITAA